MNSVNPNNWTRADRQMMSLALQLAKRGQYTARPNPQVGCVILRDSEIVGQGWHQQYGQAHAEVNALAMAGEKAKGATCYVTLEPCAHTGNTGPCAKALVEAGVSRVVAAMQDPNPKVAGGGFEILRQAGIQVESGLYQQQAESINPGFVSAHRRGRPWVTCKLAMSLDGRTALADGSSKWITGDAARADVQKLRARQDAIMTGIGTLLADDPSLTVRQHDTMPALDPWFEVAQANGFRQPARVLLDRDGRASPESKFFNADAPCYWVTNGQHLSEQKAAKVLPQQDLDQLLLQLNKEGVNTLLLEAGHKLSGAFLNAGLIDQLVIYMAPKLMGNQAMGLLDFELSQLVDAPLMHLTDLRHLGDDLRLNYEIKR